MGLIFIGLGMWGAESLSLEAVKVIKASHLAYFERYTSPVSDDWLGGIRETTKKDMTEVSREFLEDGRAILDSATDSEVVLLCPGDPLVATTHAELRIRAMERGINTRIIHAPSITNTIAGEFSLHIYNFGKAVTMTSEGFSSVNTVYDTAHKNLLRGLHTTILLGYTYPGKFAMPKEALEALLEKEKEQRLGFFRKETLALVASRIGGRDQFLHGGRVETLINEDLGSPPHTIVIPGRLHFTEAKALRCLLGLGEDELTDNFSLVRTLASEMVTRYVKKTMKALEKARIRAEKRGEFPAVFENVEAYTIDAERFLREGREELAILSIGYAEGLLDSLRLMGELEIEW